MLTGEEPGVWNEAVIINNRTCQSNNREPSDVVIDIEPIPTMVEQTKPNNRRSRLTAAEETTKKYFQRSVSISIAVLERRHVRFRYQQGATSSNMDGPETAPLIPDEYNRTVRIQRSSTTADIVTDLGELANLLMNVESITMTDRSKRTEQIIFRNKNRTVVSQNLRDTMAPCASNTQINVYGDNSLRIGPEYVTVNQSVDNNDNVITGKFLCLHLECYKPKRKREIRCGVIVFLFCCVVISSGMLHHVIKHGFGNQPPVLVERIKLDIPKWWYIERDDWQAIKERNMTCLTPPLHRVIVSHSEDADFCIEKDECIKHVQTMQKIHTDYRDWVDIGPNFLISGNGLIFEGRGANVRGAMIENDRDLTIMFLGHYERDQTCPEQFHHLEYLLTKMVDQGILSDEYVLLGHCQIAPSVISPGPNVMAELKKMDHWQGILADEIHCIGSQFRMNS